MATSSKATSREREEFKVYLRRVTPEQLQGCYDKERGAYRATYARWVEEVAAERGVSLVKLRRQQLREEAEARVAEMR